MSDPTDGHGVSSFTSKLRQYPKAIRYVSQFDVVDVIGGISS